MFQVNPTNSDQLARSVQHDYRQAATDYRLSAQGGYRLNFARTVARASVVAISIAVTFFAIVETAVL